ncbi:hypothetical protein [Aquipseudomonas alcaligenes]|uniref:Phage tail assembly protein n=1 Tax=Aquipseudomonas alcaligenes TaxID=43263 RepID=A0AA42SWJ7_AQUAC|nr:hypothetical protein [Pseudomonas alcaligenes]MDH1055307.1 hypothetical protein [Pseudomonas alcaligenes]
MSDAAGKAIVSLGGKDYIVRELSVAQLRSMMDSRAEYELLRHELFADLYLTDLPSFVNADLADIEALLPSQIEVLIAKVKEMNPHFFQLLARLKGMAAPVQ